MAESLTLTVPIAGISMGGHSTLIALRAGLSLLYLLSNPKLLLSDPQITIGIPIVGCQDYLKLTGLGQEASSEPLGTFC
jgi:hypothetical protein